MHAITIQALIPNVEFKDVTFVSQTSFCQSVCLCSDFSGHFGRGRYGEYDDAGAHRRPGSRRRMLHGDRRHPGASGPGVPHRPDTQTVATVLQHPWRAEEEEERSQQSAQTSAQQTTGHTGICTNYLIQRVQMLPTLCFTFTKKKKKGFEDED